MVPIQEHDIEDVANYMACYAFFTLEVHRCPLRIFGDVFRVLERTVTWEAPVAFKAVIQTLFERFPAVLVPAREKLCQQALLFPFIEMLALGRIKMLQTNAKRVGRCLAGRLSCQAAEGILSTRLSLETTLFLTHADSAWTSRIRA